MKNQNLLHLINAFAGLNVVVLGEAMLDSYLHGFSQRLCREAPVPVVTLSDRQNAPGGAANSAVNVRSLGGHVTFISVIGADREGQLLRQSLAEHGIATNYILAHPSRQTLTKHRVVAASQMVVRFDQGSVEPIDEETERIVIDYLSQLFPRCDALIVSDYGYGILTPRLIQAIAALQAQTPRLLSVDSKHLEEYRHAGVTIVKPNYHESTQLLGIAAQENSRQRVAQMAAYEERILDLTGAQIAAVTLDSEGALIFERYSPLYRTYARPRPHTQAAGAGDTFLSAFTLALAAGAHTPTAAELASAAATVVVGKNGTTACSINELRECVSALDKYVTNLAKLVDRVDFYRQQRQRIVFTNGCFDILHRGHITYLNRAKTLGDILVVGLNSDSSVRRLKGARRPINTQEDRAQVLAALSCIDHIIPFDEDTPIRLIQAIRPDVFVKGGDYTRQTLPEAAVIEEQGGTVQILPYLQDFSTTSIIDRIQEAYAWQANGRSAVKRYSFDLGKGVSHG
jgi:D-beta-D-heptose 7-phosphate kinase/D-beta-D-heptose 1-phosphate adenosyltransferase